MVYLQLRVNRSSTDEMYPFFEIVYTIESLFTLLFYALAPLTFFMLWNAKPLHRNLRLSLCNMILQGLFGSMARLILLYNLYTGTDHLEQHSVIIVASLFRSSFFETFTSISLFLAIERIIATFAWCWYEKESIRTLIVFVAIEGCSLIWSWGWSVSVVFEKVSVKQYITSTVGSFTIGFCVGIILIIVNYRIWARMRAGARVHGYSVARKYQIRENIIVIKALVKISTRLMLIVAPVIGLAIFQNFISGEKAMAKRLIARAFFDTIIALIPVIIITYIPLSDSIFEKALKRLKCGDRLFRLFSAIHLHSLQPNIEKTTVNETDHYFGMLARSLNGPPSR